MLDDAGGRARDGVNTASWLEGIAEPNVADCLSIQLMPMKK
jgi:hypothetical protein